MSATSPSLLELDRVLLLGRKVTPPVGVVNVAHLVSLSRKWVTQRRPGR